MVASFILKLNKEKEKGCRPAPLKRKMLKNYITERFEEITEFYLVFDDGHGNGCCFPCDNEGVLLDPNPAALKNYRYCLDHPEKFVRFNKVVERNYTIRHPAKGTCKCGGEVEFFRTYYGASQCDNCGRWYNVFGQELLPPDEWED